MASEVDKSRRYICQRFEWSIDESTFLVLDEASATWIARVWTTHLAASGMAEKTFAVLVKGYDYFIVEEGILPGLGQWVLQHGNGMVMPPKA